MDTALKVAKPSSNILEIVHRFAKVCKLKSMGSAVGENRGFDTSLGDSSEETESGNDELKIHPHSFEEMPIQINEGVCFAVETIRKLQASISTLTSAYIRLQEAHTPYNPEKIQIADEVIVSEIKSLLELKQSFREGKIAYPKSDTTSLSDENSASSFSVSSSSYIAAEILEQQGLLEKLQAQIHSKDLEILKLQQELKELDLENARLEGKIRQEDSGSTYIHRGSCIDQFREVFQTTSKSIHDFAKPLIALMKASGWDLDRAASQIEDPVVYAKGPDKKYAFDAYICQKMFTDGGWPQSHNLCGISRNQDPFDALILNPDSAFGKFCREKYLLVVHSAMEQSFFENLDQRSFVMRGGHPRTPLYQAFVKMAKWEWILMGMAGSMNPMAEIFHARKGDRYCDAYMESVVDGDREGMEVGLMVMPGFIIDETVIQCRVYLSSMNSYRGAFHMGR